MKRISQIFWLNIKDKCSRLLITAIHIIKIIIFFLLICGGYVLKWHACGDCGRTTQKGYIEILEFTHFVEFFSFNRIAEDYKEKELVRKVTVVVALDLGCGNTNNSEYESK